MGEVVSYDFTLARSAPLPEGVEPGSIFGRWAEPWAAGMAYVKLADACREMAWWRWRIAATELGKDSQEAIAAAMHRTNVEGAHWTEYHRQMLVPAPTVSALRWKQDARKYGGGHPAWERAISRDEAALADRLAAVARQQAGRAKRKVARS